MAWEWSGEVPLWTSWESACCRARSRSHRRAFRPCYLRSSRISMKLSAARIRYGPLSIKLSAHRKLGILLRLFVPSALTKFASTVGTRMSGGGEPVHASEVDRERSDATTPFLVPTKHHAYVSYAHPMSTHRRQPDQGHWMRTLATSYETARAKCGEGPLILLSDIDGTILDMRHMILSVLQSFDREHQTQHFD